MNLEELYAQVDGDYQDAIQKYGSDEKVARYLKILFKGNAVDQLAEALEAEDAEAAFAAGHNLKGTTANMSLGRMADLFSQITEVFRAGQITPESRRAFQEAKGLCETLSAGLAAL